MISLRRLNGLDRDRHPPHPSRTRPKPRRIKLLACVSVLCSSRRVRIAIVLATLLLATNLHSSSWKRTKWSETPGYPRKSGRRSCLFPTQALAVAHGTTARLVVVSGISARTSMCAFSAGGITPSMAITECQIRRRLRLVDSPRQRRSKDPQGTSQSLLRLH